MINISDYEWGRFIADQTALQPIILSLNWKKNDRNGLIMNTQIQVLRALHIDTRGTR